MEEKAAIAQLRQFCQNGAGEYEQQRDFPAVEAPAFVGQPGNGRVIASPVLASLVAEQPQALDGGAGSVWLNELIWREFYRHLSNVSPLVV